MSKLDSPILAALPTKRSSPRWMTTPQVANCLRRQGVTVNHVKTVQRRLELLLAQGIVENRRAGNALEWQRKEGAGGIAGKATALMTFDEALALQTLERLAGKQIPALVTSVLSGLFDAAKERLTHGAAHEAKHHASWHKKIALVSNGFQLIYPPVDDAVYMSVSEALFLEQLLEIRYSSRAGAISAPGTQTVMPLGLVEMAGLLYLVAQKTTKPNPVTYRLDRMTAAHVTSEPFTYPRNFSLEKYVEKDRQFDFFPQGEIRLKVRFLDGNPVLETPISKDQVVELESDESVIVRATVVMSERLRWWLRSFGPYVEILEPKSLRNEFSADAKATARLYAGRRGRKAAAQ